MRSVVRVCPLLLALALLAVPASADVFYVNDADARLYQPSLGIKQTRLLVTGSQTPAPTTATRVQFVRE